jgi:hypothetical protein
MAKDSNPLDDMKENAARTIEQTMMQTRSAVDTYFDFVQKAMSPYPSGGNELGETLKRYTEKNVAATQEFIQNLTHAKDLQDIIRIQTEFMQTQFGAFAEQAKGLGEAFTKAATGAVSMVESPFKHAK